LDPKKPIVVIVHGCFSSGSAFRSLAEVFEFHGQQTVCFNYDDRDGLRPTAARLRHVLDALQRRAPNQELVLLGHSQGGLIARIALATMSTSLTQGPGLRLVTVSSPLSGIRAASHCGLSWLHWLSLGVTTGICQAVTGSKWPEIHPRSAYWAQPEALQREVREHIMIVTDEADTCRKRGADDQCEEDDFVFTTQEQLNSRILADERARAVTVRAGHVEIVGENGRNVPEQLIRIFQREAILAPTAPERESSLRALLQRIYF
jgi:hypothetical protein